MRTPSGRTGAAQAAEDISLPYPRAIRTDDPWEAQIWTRQILKCSHHMTVLDRGSPFLAQVQFRALSGLGLMSSSYWSPVEIGCSPPINRISVTFVFGGTMLVSEGAATTVADAGHAAVLCFHEELTMRWSAGMRQLMLTIEKPRIERFLRNLLNEPIDGPLHFHPRLDLGGSGQAIAAAVLTMRRALELCGKAGPAPVLAAEIEHSVVTALLLGQRHNYTDAIFAARALPSPRVVRRVVELIDTAPQLAYTVADLARYAGVSERSLHSAFRRHLGTSPMSYLRLRRLEQAHDELLRLDPTAGARVTDVALRFGFPHTGRFAAAYRRRFGEPPSATLRR